MIALAVEVLLLLLALLGLVTVLAAGARGCLEPARRDANPAPGATSDDAETRQEGPC